MIKNKHYSSAENIHKNPDKRTGYLYYKLLTKQSDRDDSLPTLEELKMDYIQYLLKITGNNVAETANILEIPPPLLNKKIKEKVSMTFIPYKEKDI
jgi:DNA-binding NtrC family response regulator